MDKIIYISVLQSYQRNVIINWLDIILRVLKLL